MGGISGWLSPNIIQKGEISQLKKMLAAIKYRGSDIEGCYLDTHLALANNIISVTEVIPCPRPFVSEDKRFIIALDGSIFNRVDLAKALRRVGSQIKNIFDEEIAIELYRYYGVEGFSKISGAISLVMWDTQEHLGVLMRGKSAQKPLFYLNHLEHFYFASEIKAISAVIDHRLEINHAGVHALLNFQFLPGEFSLFQGVSQVKPGSAIIWQRTGIQHQVLKYKKLLGGDSVEETVLQTLKNKLDYPSETGVMLGEEPYSYLLASASKKKIMEAIKPFYLSDEFTGYQIQKNKLGLPGLLLDAEEMEVPKLDIDFFRKMIWHMELPLPSGIHPFIRYQACAGKRKIFISSAGANEAFMNKKNYLYLSCANLMSKLKLHKVTHPLLKKYDSKYSAYDIFGFGSKAMKKYSCLHSLGQLPMLYALLNGFWDIPSLRQKIYGEAILDTQKNIADVSSMLLKKWSTRGSILDQARRFELEYKLPMQTLWAEDRASEAISSESRCVYLDATVLATLRNETTQELFRLGKPHAFYKHAFSDLLPAQLFAKSSFYHPKQELLNIDIQNWMSEVYKVYLSPDMINKHQLFNAEFIFNLLRLKNKHINFWQVQILFMMAGIHALLEMF